MIKLVNKISYIYLKLYKDRVITNNIEIFEKEIFMNVMHAP
jgi:hypothetical protein